MRNKKLTKRDIANKQARFDKMCEEFKVFTVDELRIMFQEKKMSSTDRYALIQITQEKLMQEKFEKSKELVKEDNIEGE